MPDGWLDTLLDESVRMGAAVAVILCGILAGGLFVVNLKWPMLISYRAHQESLADAQQDAADARADLDSRVRELREDFASRIDQTRIATQAELDRLLKIIDALQRDVESWRQAYHLEAATNDAEGDARWDRIDAALVVLHRLATEVQRQAHLSISPVVNDHPGGGPVVR